MQNAICTDNKEVIHMLKGKVAVVTGGTRGIGYAVVELFLKNGASVALLGSRQQTVDKALASLKETNPDWPVIGMAPDLTDYKAVEETMNAVKEKFGKIDILVNNAGLWRGFCEFQRGHSTRMHGARAL